jgi:hypothetical protein
MLWKAGDANIYLYEKSNFIDNDLAINDANVSDSTDKKQAGFESWRHGPISKQ